MAGSMSFWAVPSVDPREVIVPKITLSPPSSAGREYRPSARLPYRRPIPSDGKWGAHNPSHVITAAGGLKTFEKACGKKNIAFAGDWLAGSSEIGTIGVRIITAVPEVNGVLDAAYELTKRGIIHSIGCR